MRWRDWMTSRLSKHIPGVVGMLLLSCLALSPAEAKPQHLKSLAEHYGRFLPAALNNCATCHQPAVPGKPADTLEGFPHNAFGAQLRKAGEELRAGGRRADISARLLAIAGQDADGDGAANELELLLGHAPGNPKDAPTAAERKAAAARQNALAQFLASYRWRPFEPVRRPPVPAVKRAEWVRNPIDAFVEAEREKRGLRPRPPASREVLLRRVYLDLIGLSPTPEEVAAFDRECDLELQSARGARATGPKPVAPGAYARVVDRLLAHPRYGERWARHWMDVWRYSDWAGYGQQVRDSLPHIWRWRDWIVDSLNADKGYDRMVQEMLAGDELAPLDPDVLRATGYLVRNFKLLSREKWMEDVVDHTGQAFLGLTLGCARCHDHMYDPITQKEYYRFRAIFEPHHVRTDRVPGELDIAKAGLPRAYDQKPDAPTYLYERGDERHPVKDEVLAPGVPEALGGKLEVQPVPLPRLAVQPDKQPHVIEALRADAARQVNEARQAVQAGTTAEDAPLIRLRLERAEAAQAALEAVLVVERLEDEGRKDSAEWRQAAATTLRLQRKLAVAEARLKREEASRALAAAKPAGREKAQTELKKAEEALAKAEAEAAKPDSTAYQPRVTTAYPEQSTGRRLALARWLTARENPLAARVAANHIWLRHFGEALVPSVADLGRGGQQPTHPELLDWLAAELMEPSGGRPAWSMKHLHRLIVTSNTYRMASTPDPVSLAKDPDNRYLWRMNYRRMDAEVVRDNVLYVAGELDLKRGGPDIDENEGLRVKRRSLYFRQAAEKQMVFTALFDGPNITECYRRKETVIPQQALALANSELSLVQARLLARKLSEGPGADPARFVSAAFERVLARAATPAELRECLEFLRTQAKLLSETIPPSATAPPSDGSVPAADPAARARENLILVLLNHNDFITIR
jgi:hypothetical protein